MVGQLNKALSLTDILQGGYPPSHPETTEQIADAALVARDWQRAVEAYEQCKDAAADLRVDEKRGWCLGKKQAWTEALAALVPHRNELSSAGLTMLAIASVGGWAARYKRDDSARAEFDATLAKALADEAPPYLTYAALFWFRDYRQDEEVLLAHARKAVSLYPDEPYLRLKLADCLRRRQGDEAEIYAVLKAGLDAHSTTEYLWTCVESASRLGRWEDALAQLNQALAMTRADMTRADGDRSHQTGLQMQLARAELLVSAGRTEEAVNAYRELAAMDMAEAGHIVQAARRALLAVACRAEEDKQIRQALKGWLASVVASFDRYQISDLLVGECEPIYFFDGDVGSCVSGESLIPHRERLLETAEDSERGIVRFLFAECERESDDYDPQTFAKSMLQAEKETDNPVILGALATAYAVKKRPNWRSAGSAWTRHELHRLSGNISTYSIEPLSEDDPPSDAALEAYAKGMRQEFQVVAPSPHLAEIFATLRCVLVDKKMYRIFRDLAELVASGSDDPDVIFDAALGAHWCKDRARAIELYWEVLSRNKTHYSALYNLLLLYRSPKDAIDVERIAKLVEVFPTEDSERRSKLLGVLDNARAACRDPQEAVRNVIRAELGQYPGLIQGPIKVAKLPLQSAVTLITLMEMCESVEGGLVYQPFGGCSSLFSPTMAHRQGLFRLLEAGLVAIADDTPVEAFNVKDGKVRGYYFDKIWWRVSPATISLAQSIKEVAGKSVWPRRWCEEVMLLAETIAEEECFQYVVHAAESRNWPIPDDDLKVHALAKSLAQHVSVSEAFYLIYLGAMAASDHRQRYPVSTQQTSNLMLLRASRKLDRWLADPWPLKKYSRSKEVPRSEMSRVLYEEFLRVGERGFSEPVSQLPYPKPRKSSARSR